MSGKFLKKLITVLTLAAITAGLAGCSSTDAGGGLQKVLDSGVLVLGLDENYPPMGYRDESGEIDAIAIDSILAYYYINETGKDYYILSEVLESEDIAIGFRKCDTDLRDKIQEILDEMSEDGTLAEISTRWFGADVTTVK